MKGGRGGGGRILCELTLSEQLPNDFPLFLHILLRVSDMTIKDNLPEDVYTKLFLVPCLQFCVQNHFVLSLTNAFQYLLFLLFSL